MVYNWKLTTFLICAYGLMKELRPAVPFLTPYLVSPVKNLTDEQLYSQVYPFWTYSYLVALIPVFFLTDLLRYKPVVILEALTLIATWALLIWGVGVFHMQVMQTVFGVASAAEIAYYSYIYSAVDDQHYKKVTSYVRGAALFGKTIAYGLAQLLVWTQITTNYLLLNYISLAAVSVTLPIAVFLPSPAQQKPTTLAYNADDQEKEVFLLNFQNQDALLPQQESSNGDTAYQTTVIRESNSKLAQTNIGGQNRVTSYLRSTYGQFGQFLSNPFVLKWSLWWSLASCGMFQVWNYIQTLWAVMQTDTGSVQNGITECAATLIGAGVAFSMQYLTLDWSKRGELVLTVTSCVEACLLILLAKVANIYVSYVLYIFVCAFYQMLITVASHNIASKLESASYGLVFGWNTFVALFLQTLLTIAVADSKGFALHIRDQFTVYGLYYAAIAFIFFILTIYRALTNRHN